MGKINYYNDSIAIENKGQPELHSIYRIMWPNLLKIEDIRGKDPQFYGLDHIVHLEGNMPLPIQAKVRNTSFTDILLEYVSNDKTGSSGWMEMPLICSHFFYLVIPNNTCFWFNFPSLLAFWNKHKKEWIKFGEQKSYGFRKIIAPNKEYNTVSVAVPAKVLLTGVFPNRVFHKEVGVWK